MPIRRLLSFAVGAGLVLLLCGFIFMPLRAPCPTSTPSPSPSCSGVSGNLAQLPCHLMMGVVSFGTIGGTNDGSQWAANNSIAIDTAYQYFNPGWNTAYSGSFVSQWIAAAKSHGQIPTITFYQAQSNAYTWTTAWSSQGAPEDSESYFTLEQSLFTQIAATGSGGSGGWAIVDLEPDALGQMQQFCEGTNGGTINAATCTGMYPSNGGGTFVVGSSGYTGVSGFSSLPNSAAGVLQGIVLIARAFCPKCIIAYHSAPWADSNAGYNPVTNPSAAATAGDDIGNWYNSAFGMTTGFDLFFADISDRDSAWNDLVCAKLGGTPNALAYWYGVSNNGEHGPSGTNNFTNFASYLAAFNATTGLKIVIWQIPAGNTIMEAENDNITSEQPNGYYGGDTQDDRVQYFLTPGNANLTTFINSGVIGLDFGGGQESPYTGQCGGSGGSPADYSTTFTTNFDDFISAHNPGAVAIEDANAAGTFPTNFAIGGTTWNGSTTNVPSLTTDNDGGLLAVLLEYYYAHTPLPAVVP
jgi:hypothetical protein